MRDRAVLMDFYALDRAEFDALTLEEFRVLVTNRNQTLGVDSGDSFGGDS